jgi:hypothetical protein
MDQPTLAAEEVEYHTAIELALPSCRMFGDIGRPQLIGSLGTEVTLDQVFAGGGVHEVFLALLRTWKTLEAKFTHDPLDQLVVDGCRVERFMWLSRT